jgi:putative proteasome-type protease
MTAGNLATTQAVVSLLNERAKPAPERERAPSILELPSMFQVARLVGRDAARGDRAAMPRRAAGRQPLQRDADPGGQVKGGEPRLFLIYPEGNFIEASETTRPSSRSARRNTAGRSWCAPTTRT